MAWNHGSQKRLRCIRASVMPLLQVHDMTVNPDCQGAARILEYKQTRIFFCRKRNDSVLGCVLGFGGQLEVFPGLIRGGSRAAETSQKAVNCEGGSCPACSSEACHAAHHLLAHLSLAPRRAEGGFFDPGSFRQGRRFSGEWFHLHIFKS